MENLDIQKNAQYFINTLSANGDVSFTFKQMQMETGNSTKAVERALYRLKRKGEIATVAKGFYLILPPEFRKLGCLPPDYFIDDLMNHWGEKYYVALLSAALYHGAAHQQPQIFQVITDQYHPPIHCGHVHIEFSKKKTIIDLPITRLKTHTGMMNISTPEATMMDLLIFIRRCGGISHVATVLNELADSADRKAINILLENSIECTWKQRMGYLLDYVGHAELSKVIFEHLKNKRTNIVPLVPYYPITGTERNAKWRIAINTKVEDDLHDSD